MESDSSDEARWQILPPLMVSRLISSAAPFRLRRLTGVFHLEPSPPGRRVLIPPSDRDRSPSATFSLCLTRRRPFCIDAADAPIPTEVGPRPSQGGRPPSPLDLQLFLSGPFSPSAN